MELVLILMKVKAKEMGEMRVKLIFIAKVEATDQVGINLIEKKSLI